MMFCVAASGPEQTPADGADATEDAEENPEDPRSHTNIHPHIYKLAFVC